MLEAGAESSDLAVGERGDLEGSEGHGALIRVKAALSKLVLPAADHVHGICEEQRVIATTTDLDHLAVFQHVKRRDSRGEDNVRRPVCVLLDGQLPELVVAPGVHRGLLESGLGDELPGHGHCEVFAAGDAFDPVGFQRFHQTW